MSLQGLIQAATAVAPAILLNPGASLLPPQAALQRQTAHYQPAVPETEGNRLAFETESRAAAKLTNDNPNGDGDAIRALARLRVFRAWKDGWDGEGAPAPNSDSVDVATHLLGSLFIELGQVPKVALNSEGEPMFMLFHDGLEVSVTISSPLEVSYFLAKGEVEYGGLVEFDGRTLPDEVRLAIRAIRAT